MSVLCLGTASAQSAKKNAGLLQTPAVVSAPTKRIALIIGNHQYQRLSKLPNAGRDADAMAVALKAAGFTPTIAKDLSYTAMVEVVAQFLKTINKGDEVVVFFSGHGVQIPKQGGYLLPIDVSTTSASKVDKTAYELETLMAEVAEANPAFSLFIVDACRDNPFATKGVGTGFTNPEAAQGQIVLFAASRNQQALEKLSDDDKDPNGVFTREFIKRMKTPGLEISDLMKEVQNSVEKLANKVGHKQRPAIVNEARGNFYFFGPTTVQVNAANATAPDALELQFWQSTEKQNTKEAYLAYKKRYARGQFVDLADGALARIVKEEAALEAQNQRPIPPAANLQPLPVIVATNTVATTPTRSGQVFKDCADCPEMVVIPAGSFIMGSESPRKGRREGDDDELPQRTVSVKTFALGRTEVTQRVWRNIMGANPSGFIGCGDDCPVEQVSWVDAQAFVKMLNVKTGKKYHLPSEAQWEYAARGGTNTEYWWGNLASHEFANYGREDCCRGFTAGSDKWFNTSPVAQFPANPFGLFDMNGNVWEWVQDKYHKSYIGAPKDGSAWEQNSQSGKRILRGGGWQDPGEFIRTRQRRELPKESLDLDYGFRIARSL